jgi:hypothetical protein
MSDAILAIANQRVAFDPEAQRGLLCREQPA